MTNSAQDLAINAIRTLSMDAVQLANSGHPGAPMGLAAVAYTLFAKHMHFDAKDPEWANRDRFVLSNGHASMLLYSLLHLIGVKELDLDEIKQFRQWGSLTPGHPEAELTPGVEVTTGPLGQGISTSVGLAMAEAQLHARFDGMIDHYTYVICSDGDLMEGISHEAASLAGHLGLGKLVVLYDDNEITIDGRTDVSFTEDVLKRFEAYGWHTDRVTDGNDVDAIDAAITAAKSQTDKPSLIAVRTVIGFGSPNKADHSKSHGSPLGDDEILLTKEALGWPYTEPFTVPQEAYDAFNDLATRSQEAHASWDAKLDEYNTSNLEKHTELTRRLSGALPEGWKEKLPSFAPDAKGLATRASSGKVIQKIYEALPELVGGSADLAGSNKTFHKEFGIFTHDQRDAQNVHFGVREHGMAAAANGMCLHGGVRGFGATFLVFSDYMRPALRLAALMHTPQLMVFTHDSIGLGEDGPTHQPVEHLMSLRAMPNYFVFRPADANEVTESWIAAIERINGPSCLVLTRQNVPTYDREKLSTKGDASRGGYILSENPAGKETPDAIILATGSEVAIAIEAQKTLLETHNISARVVSIPCWKLFLAQDDEWQSEVIPDAVTARVSIEAGTTFGWQQFTGSKGISIGLDRFGASAPFEELYAQFGLTSENVTDKVVSLVK